MIFRNVFSADLPQIASLYRAAIGFPGCTWNESYPGAFELEQDFASGNLYVLSEGETVIGAVSVVSPNELDNAYTWEVQNAREIARVVISYVKRSYDKSQGCGSNPGIAFLCL